MDKSCEKWQKHARKGFFAGENRDGLKCFRKVILPLYRRSTWDSKSSKSPISGV
jgi:hypothetical protein